MILIKKDNKITLIILGIVKYKQIHVTIIGYIIVQRDISVNVAYDGRER